MRIDAVIPQAEFVYQRGIEEMRFADGHAAVRVVLVPAEKISAIQGVSKRRRNELRLVLIAKANEGIILVGEFVVHAEVEIVPRGLLHWQGKVIEVGITRIRSRIQGRKLGGERVNGSCPGGIQSTLKKVGRISARVDANGHTAKPVGIQIGSLGEAGIEEFTDKGWIAAAVHRNLPGGVAIRIGSKDWSGGEHGGEVSTGHTLCGNSAIEDQAFAGAEPFVVGEEKRAVLGDGAAKGHAKLILFVRLAAKPLLFDGGVGGVQHLVPQEFVYVSMKTVRAGLDHRIHDGAVAAAKFGAIRIGLHLEFSDRID